MMILFRKELLELRRTYRGFIILVLFVFFGLTSPLVAKILPDLMEALVEDMIIQLPEPTWLDAFMQYFKNLIQLGLLALILTTMGTVAEEKAKNTALLVLARPVSRHTFVWAKFLAVTVVLAAATLISYAACYYYSWVLFRPFPIALTLQATLLFFAYALFITALTVCASSWAQSGATAGGLAVAGFFLASTLPSLHRVFARYSPGALSNMINQLLTERIPFSETMVALGVTVVSTLVLVLLGSWLFSRQEV